MTPEAFWQSDSAMFDAPVATDSDLSTPEVMALNGGTQWY